MKSTLRVLTATEIENLAGPKVWKTEADWHEFVGNDLNEHVWNISYYRQQAGTDYMWEGEYPIKYTELTLEDGTVISGWDGKETKAEAETKAEVDCRGCRYNDTYSGKCRECDDNFSNWEAEAEAEPEPAKLRILSVAAIERLAGPEVWDEYKLEYWTSETGCCFEDDFTEAEIAYRTKKFDPKKPGKEFVCSGHMGGKPFSVPRRFTVLELPSGEMVSGWGIEHPEPEPEMSGWRVRTEAEMPAGFRESGSSFFRHMDYMFGTELSMEDYRDMHLDSYRLQSQWLIETAKPDMAALKQKLEDEGALTGPESQAVLKAGEQTASEQFEEGFPGAEDPVSKMIPRASIVDELVMQHAVPDYTSGSDEFMAMMTSKLAGAAGVPFDVLKYEAAGQCMKTAETKTETVTDSKQEKKTMKEIIKTAAVNTAAVTISAAKANSKIKLGTYFNDKMSDFIIEKLPMSWILKKLGAKKLKPWIEIVVGHASKFILELISGKLSDHLQSDKADFITDRLDEIADSSIYAGQFRAAEMIDLDKAEGMLVELIGKIPEDLFSKKGKK